MGLPISIRLITRTYVQNSANQIAASIFLRTNSTEEFRPSVVLTGFHDQAGTACGKVRTPRAC